MTIDIFQETRSATFLLSIWKYSENIVPTGTKPLAPVIIPTDSRLNLDQIRTSRDESSIWAPLCTWIYFRIRYDTFTRNTCSLLRWVMVLKIFITIKMEVDEDLSYDLTRLCIYLAWWFPNSRLIQINTIGGINCDMLRLYNDAVRSDTEITNNHDWKLIVVFLEHFSSLRLKRLPWRSLRSRLCEIWSDYYDFFSIRPRFQSHCKSW